MWPWEHLAFGYVLASGYARVVHGERVGNADALVLAVGTQLPDLVDKPLAWSLDILPSGTSLAHSVLFALPTCALVTLIARRYSLEAVGRAFCIGYLSHLLGDVFYPLAAYGYANPSVLLWPLVPQPDSVSQGSITTGIDLFEQFTTFLGPPRGRLYLAFEGLLLGFALVVWAADGFPGRISRR